MALQRQNLPLVLTGGTDTKTDPKQVVAGKLLLCQNAVFTNPKELRKRPGATALSQNITGGLTNISVGQGLTTLNNELVLFSTTKLHTYNESLQNWVTKGTVVSSVVNQLSIDRSSGNDTGMDSAIHASGLAVFAWTNVVNPQGSGGSTYYSVVDTLTGAKVVASGVLNTIGTKVKCATIGQLLVVLCEDTSFNIAAYTIPVGNPTAAPTKTAFIGDLNHTHNNWDATVMNGVVYVAYNSSTALTVSAGSFTQALTSASGAVISNANANGCIGIFANTGTFTTLGVAFSDTTNVYFLSINSDLSLNQALTTVEAAVNAFNITGLYPSATASLWYTVLGSPTYNNLVRFNTVNPTTAVAAHGTLTLSSASGTVGGAINGTSVTVTASGGDTATATALAAAINANATTKLIVHATSALGVVTITAIARGTAGNSITLTASGTGVTRSGATLTGGLDGAGTAKACLRSTYIAGKAFTYGGNNYLLVAYASPTNLQNTAFLINGATTPSVQLIIAKVSPTLLQLTLSGCLVPEVTMTSTGVFQYATAIADRIDTITGSSSGSPLFTSSGVNSTTINFYSPNSSYTRTAMADTLTIGGGYPYLYDSGTVTEEGFHVFPEFPATGISKANSGGSITDGTHAYIITYEWTDAQGNVYRSCPSIGVSNGANSGGAGNASTNTLTIPTLRITSKALVSIVVYRTTANGSQYQRISSITAPLINDPTVDTVSYVDTLSDAGQAAGENLYTFGGVVENISPPAAVALCTFQNRVMLLPSENRQTTWFSKQVVPGTAIQFSDFFTLPVDPFGGDIVAIAPMDAYFVQFKQTCIYQITGDGPDDTGNQWTFTPAALITTDVGCIDARSVVLMPMGLMFRGQKGIYLLGRGLDVQYIGADVQAFVTPDVSVVAATLVSSKNQVHFCLSNGMRLTYDYFMQQWGNEPLVNLVDATVWQQQYCYLQSFGRVMVEDASGVVFSDAGEFYPLKMQTSWLNFAGVSGLQRVYNFMILGDYQSPHQLKVSIAYDFNPTPTQVVLIDATAIDPGFWGDGATWGSDPVWGGGFPSYQYRVNLTQQKCTSMQITIEDVQTGIAPGEGMRLSNLTFIAGMKSGFRKVGADHVVGGTT